MKLQAKWLMLPVVMLGLGACKKAEQPKTPETPPAETPAAKPDGKPAPEKPVPTPPAVSVDERAAKLGFAKYLPQDTEVLMSFHNGSDTASRVKSSKLWKLMQSEMGMGGMEAEPIAPDEIEEEEFELPEGEQADEELAEDATDGAVIGDAAGDLAGDEAAEEIEMAEPVGPAALFGTEFTIALGKPACEQTANLLTAYSRVGYIQIRALTRAFAAAAEAKDPSVMDEMMMNSYSEEFFKDLISEPEYGAKLYEKMQMPPLYLAFRTREADREGAAQQIAASVENLSFFGEIVEPASLEKDGQTFAGYRISGAKIAASMEENRDDMDEAIGKDVADKLIAATAEKNLVVLSGVVGDYVVMFIGSSIDEFRLAASAGESLVASDSLKFCDTLLAKDLAAVMFGKKEMLEGLIKAAGGFADISSAISEGLADSKALGDTRDLVALLRLVAEREAALRSLAHVEEGGTVAFFEDGLRIESFGGIDAGAVDWKATNRLASLGSSQEVVMFLNMTANAAYDEKSREYFEALVQTAYAGAMKAAELEIEDSEFAQFKEMAKLFDNKFRSDLLGIWDTLNADFSRGLGKEGALVVDLKGAMPGFPGIPQKVVDEAKFPRITWVAPVTDRAKLAASWTKVNASATSILAKISEMTEQDIPMQKPLSTDKDGFTTWFFTLPFLSDDFIPSVTVGDKWFAASTSKNQALDLLAMADKGGETSTGLNFTMNFKALQNCLGEMTAVIEKNSDALPFSPGDLDTFKKMVSALDDVEKLSVHCRQEDGKLRTSIHFKTR